MRTYIVNQHEFKARHGILSCTHVHDHPWAAVDVTGCGEITSNAAPTCLAENVCTSLSIEAVLGQVVFSLDEFDILCIWMDKRIAIPLADGAIAVDNRPSFVGRVRTWEEWW